MTAGTIAKGNEDHRNRVRNLRWNYSRNELFVNKIVKEKPKAHDKQAKSNTGSGLWCQRLLRGWIKWN